VVRCWVRLGAAGTHRPYLPEGRAKRGAALPSSSRVSPLTCGLALPPLWRPAIAVQAVPRRGGEEA